MYAPIQCIYFLVICTHKVRRTLKGVRGDKLTRRAALGRTIGHLAALHTEPMEPTEEDIATLKIFAARGCAELERKQSDERLRKAHAELRRTGEAWVLVDLGSRNGTRVNGWRADSGFTVRAGDWVSFGRAAFRIADHG